MNYKIAHEIKGRIRFKFDFPLSNKVSDYMADYMEKINGVKTIKIYEKTGSIAIEYGGKRENIIEAIKNFNPNEAKNYVNKYSGNAINRYYGNKIKDMIFNRVILKIFLPLPLKKVRAFLRSIPYIKSGIKSLLKRKLEVAVLDAAAIGVSMITGDYNTASSVMFLLRIGELLEEWTHKKSVNDLAKSLSINVDRVWLKTEQGEVLTPTGDICENDLVIVRMGAMIPLDGIVEEGEAMVNQASLTGESIPVCKREGITVYAGTVVEDGEIVIRVKNTSGQTRFDNIVKMIESSEKLKSSVESNAGKLADKLVPVSFLGSIFTYVFTKNINRAISILMVDYSCALKLSMPLAVLSAMRECGKYNIVVKGGKFLEAVANADTAIFDKTGTLTKSEPRVAEVIPFGDYTRDEMLRLAACLEEHFPHSIANAVVRQAEIENLSHAEMHTKLDYIVAHGIASYVGEKRVLIGSYHFIFEDEKTELTENICNTLENLPKHYSYLYLSIAGKLAAVICIEDPLKENVKSVFEKLRKLGISKIVMLTGDSERTAKAIAEKIEADEYCSEVLPEDKAAYVEKEKKAGRKVIMVGDGINDSLALSKADAGIAMKEGAEVTREVADITISGDDLEGLIILKRVSNQLMKRINRNYRFVAGFNTGLIVLGAAGVLAPASSALFHNISTIAVSLESMTDLIK